MIIVFIGPPYAGKNTQGKLLSEELGNIPVLSVGALIREAREQGNKIFIKAYEQYSLKGLHLPTAIKFPLLKKKMDSASNGFILENFPATEDDLIMFNSYLSQTNQKISRALYLYISDEEMQQRFKNTFRGRKDDDPDIIAARREIQDQNRIPVLEFYKSRNLLSEIDGEGDVDKVHRRISQEIRKKVQ